MRERKKGLDDGPEPSQSRQTRRPAPPDRHLIVEGSGIPLAYASTPGNRHDVTQLWPLPERIPPVAGRVGRVGRVGRPRSTPGVLYADRGYDYPINIHRRPLHARGIKHLKHRIARRGHDHGSGLGTIRWVVERTSARLPPGCAVTDASSPATNAAKACTKRSWDSAAALPHLPETTQLILRPILNLW